MESKKYTIKEINKDGNVVVTCECDGKDQILVDAPTDSREALEAFMDSYMESYIAGKKIEAQNVSKEVKDLVGKTLEAKTEDS